MSASSSTAPLVFGLVVLDLQKRELTRKGRARPLRATSFDVLAYLAANAGRIISNGRTDGRRLAGPIGQRRNPCPRPGRSPSGPAHRCQRHPHHRRGGLPLRGRGAARGSGHGPVWRLRGGSGCATVTDVTVSRAGPRERRPGRAWWLAAAALVVAAGACGWSAHGRCRLPRRGARARPPRRAWRRRSRSTPRWCS